MAFYEVIYTQGAFIDDFFYTEGSIVELDDGLPAPRWGVPCTANGTRLSNTPNNGLTADDHLAYKLSNKIAAHAGEPTAPVPTPQSTGTPAVTTPGLDQAREEQIAMGLGMLEATNDGHWTKNGEARLDVLNDFLKLTTPVTRAELECLKPDFKRP
jgi:hypothetical protein